MSGSALMAASGGVDALIAGADLAGRTRVGCGARSRRCWRCGGQGHGERVWRKVKSDWEAWNARSWPMSRSCG